MGSQKLQENVGYGPLRAVNDRTTGLPLLLLPRDFTYQTFGYAGEPLTGGGITPPLHDGMGAFGVAHVRGVVRLVRNHEVTDAAGAFLSAPVYDRAAGGGTTTIEFDTDKGSVLRAWGSLGGTLRNCAGGKTPWGTWLTCEEAIADPGGDSALLQPHGYVFEVPSDGSATAAPLKAMGRFVHEAVAVDSQSGHVYETEDSRSAGFYRFIPDQPSNLSNGGKLEMMAISGYPNYDTRTCHDTGRTYSARWVPIRDPDRIHNRATKIDYEGVFMQGYELGGAVFARLEGAVAAANCVYFAATNGGRAGCGQIWAYEVQQSKLRLVFESPGREALEAPDNLCISPRGGLVVCEDGGGEQLLRGVTPDGRIFPFAKNNVSFNGSPNGVTGDYRSSELAGLCYSPNGEWLFFNVQNPGFTVAVTGPWRRGPL